MFMLAPRTLTCCWSAPASRRPTGTSASLPARTACAQAGMLTMKNYG